MSAPVIFSSPLALQEPFKGPNTDENTHAYKKKKVHEHHAYMQNYDFKCKPDEQSYNV